MSNPVRRVLVVGALVLAIPAACVGAVALYGRALAESEVAIGTIVTPEEGRARLEAARARFQAMTPAQHLAEARRALAAGYDPATQTGGSFGGAAVHCRAIPEGAPEHAQVGGIMAEVTRRRGNLYSVAASRLSGHLRDHGAVASEAEGRKRAARTALAADVDELARVGLGCVHVADQESTTLRFDHGDCDQQMVEGIARPQSHAGLRAFGFRRVRCNNGRGVIDL